MKSNECTKESGTCRDCQAACGNKPGWFKAGEAEKVAEYLGVGLVELFRDKLAVDWWCGEGKVFDDIFVISPALVNEDAGSEFPGDPRGECVFFKEGRCEIHAVKPFECAESVPCEHNGKQNLHKEAADSWNTSKSQAQIVELLGREPQSAEFEGGGIFGLFGF